MTTFPRNFRPAEYLAGMPDFDAQTLRVGIRRPTTADYDEFVSLMVASKSLHDPWVDLPNTRQRYDAYLRLRQSPTEDAFLICDRKTRQIAGLINLNCIV